MAENTTKKPGFFSKVKNVFKGIGKFFRDTKSELKKVVWPTKSVIIASIFILLLDLLFGGILHFVLDAASKL